MVICKNCDENGCYSCQSNRQLISNQIVPAILKISPITIKNNLSKCDERRECHLHSLYVKFHEIGRLFCLFVYLSWDAQLNIYFINYPLQDLIL